MDQRKNPVLRDMEKFRARIGVIGTDGEIPEDVQRIAERIGFEIAKNNCILVCGGKSGVMESACKGAKKANGITVGILPSLEKTDGNQYIDIPITTGMGYARNAFVVSSSDVVIAIGGRAGTMSEIGLALSYDKPVILVKGTGGISDLIKEDLEKIGVTRGIYLTTPENAVEFALKLIR